MVIVVDGILFIIYYYCYICIFGGSLGWMLVWFLVILVSDYGDFGFICVLFRDCFS